MSIHNTTTRVILFVIGLSSCLITASCASRPPHMAKSKIIKIKRFHNPEIAHTNTTNTVQQLQELPSKSKG